MVVCPNADVVVEPNALGAAAGAPNKPVAGFCPAAAPPKNPPPAGAAVAAPKEKPPAAGAGAPKVGAAVAAGAPKLNAMVYDQ